MLVPVDGCAPRELYALAPRPGDQRRAGWRCAAAFGFQSELELLRRSERRAFFVDDEPASACIRHALAERNPLALALGPGLIALSARRWRQVGERENCVRGSRPGSVVSVRRGGCAWGGGKPQHLGVAGGYQSEARPGARPSRPPPRTPDAPPPPPHRGPQPHPRPPPHTAVLGFPTGAGHP